MKFQSVNPIGRAALEVNGRRLGEHVFTVLEGTTVIVTDTPAVRKPVVDSTYFASN